ncbi:uncharacterized protein [Periplaneta americana]|uniref:uncharacterized protein isoform X1 n=1 Tax=Periplaneta americana TaxID=6978 RepID=UPI0037E9B0E9
MACTGCDYTLSEFLTQFIDSMSIEDYLVAHGVLRGEVNCTSCGRSCSLSVSKSGELFFRCNKGPRGNRCGFRKSARKGTFVGESTLSVKQIVTFCSMWCLLPNPRHKILMKDVEIGPACVVDWSGFCRQVCVDWVLNNRRCIGGPGTIVELDVSKFGCRKYSKGQRIKGQWVFGGVERGNPRNFFLVPVKKRNVDTLRQIITDWILPQTTIVSDCWKVYNAVQDKGFLNLRMNHSVEFVDTADSGEIHQDNLRHLGEQDISVDTENANLDTQNVSLDTQNIKRKWLSLKYSIPTFGRRKEHFEGYFAEYIFKENYPHTRRICEFFKRAALLFPPPL